MSKRRTFRFCNVLKDDAYETVTRVGSVANAVNTALTPIRPTGDAMLQQVVSAAQASTHEFRMENDHSDISSVNVASSQYINVIKFIT